MTIRDRKLKNISFNQTRTFGVEIEMTWFDRAKADGFVNPLGSGGSSSTRSDSDLLARFLTAYARLDARGVGYYGNTTPNQRLANTKVWEVKTDGSVGGMGLELVSHILKGNDGIAELKALCDALAFVDAKVDRSCGLHVHWGKKGFSLAAEAQLMNLYNANAIALSAMLPSSRASDRGSYGVFNAQSELVTKTDSANNRQLESASDPTGLNARRGYTSGRYAVNFRPRYTVEFRQHGGTTDFEKISNWVYLTQAFMNEAMRRVGVKSAKRKSLVSVSVPSRLLVDCVVLNSLRSAGDGAKYDKVHNAFVKQAVRTMLKSLKLKYVTTSLYPTDDAMGGLSDYVRGRAKDLAVGKRGRTMSSNTSLVADMVVGTAGSYSLVGQSTFTKVQMTNARVKAAQVLLAVRSDDWDGKVTKLYQ